MVTFYANDDDIKIAPEDLSKLFTKENPQADDNIDLLMRQRSNGNTARAKLLGKQYTADLIDCVWTKAPQDVDASAFELQLKLLFAYVVHRIISDYSPNAIIENSVLSSFFENLEDADPQLSKDINNNGAFSLYVLLHRSGEENAEKIGKIFADNCNAGLESDCNIIGESAYARYLSACTQRMLATEFVED